MKVIKPRMTYQDKEKNIEFIDKLKLSFVEQKIKIILILSSFIIILIIFVATKIFQERKNILVSEKFIKANIFLSSENKDKSKE